VDREGRMRTATVRGQLHMVVHAVHQVQGDTMLVVFNWVDE
jgi:hypothetical protein